MKKVLLLCVVVINMFAMGAETIESLNICKSKDYTYLVTVSDNETEGRAIWIDDYELLVGDYPTILIPIHDKKSFKKSSEITVFMKKHFGASSCLNISYEEVQKEIDKQAEEYKGIISPYVN